MKKLLIISLFAALVAPLIVAQEFPEPMQPPRLVNDFANFFSQGDANQLESKLLNFNNQTSTQIFVVTVPTLNGYEPNDYTTRLAEKWKVGMKGKDNGVMILIKPKTPEEKGQVYIAVGYGLEPVLTDLQANQIVTKDILPAFREGNSFAGIDAATTAIMNITSGEFTADQYLKKGNVKKGNSFIGLIIMIILFSILFGGRSGKNRHNSMGGNLPLLFLLGMMGGRGNGGSFGGFSSGGGFGGGFGGGGGGSFGGGGAGGSW